MHTIGHCGITLGCLSCALAMTQATAQEPLRDKTLVVWVAPANLDQGGGTALTLDGWHGLFDGVVFGELAPRRWMPGSDGFSRTLQDQAAWPEETASPNEFVQIAIVYRDQEIAVFRNGEPYAAYAMPSPARAFPENSVVMFGRRHLDLLSGDDSFVGRIKDARIYDQALDPETIAALEPGSAKEPAPWAWWFFGDGRIEERTGRYAESRLVGDVRVENGALALGGNGATLTAYQEPDTTATTTAWVAGEAVPRQAVESARALRTQMLADPYRPAFHFVMPEDNGMPGDPNGAVYYNGRYHLMYLYHDGRAFVWGHASSKDLMHWRYHPTALGPGEGDDGIFSGGAFADADGTVTLTYWALGDPPRGIGIAQSSDESLDSWTKSEENPVIQSTQFGYTVTQDAEGNEVVYGSADPSNIWMNDGRYYMLTGNLLVLNKYGTELGQVEHQGDTAYLFVSDDLTKWDYLHPFYQSNRAWTHAGEDNMCPTFLPLPSSPDGGPASDKHLMLFISHCDGCQYYTGSYADDHFTLETHGRMTWTDNGYFAPEALVDDRGRLIMWAWLLDNPPQDVVNAQGWQGVYGLPRVLWLREDGALGIRPADEITALRQEEQRWDGLTIKAGSDLPLDGLDEELLELEITIEPGDATEYGVRVCCSEDGQEQTVISYDAVAKELKLDTTRSSLGFGKKAVEVAPFELGAEEALTLRVFVDRSVIEIYANDRQAIARRIYPTLAGRGVSLLSINGAVEASVRAWELMPSNAY